MKRLLLLFLIQAVAIFAVGCGSSTSAPGFFLAGLVEIELEGGESAKAEREIRAFLDAFEQKVSVSVEGSDVWNVNRAKAGEPVAVCDWTAELLALAKALTAETGGAFDAALFPLTRLWGFSPENEGSYSEPRPEPGEEAIAQALAACGSELFTVSGNTVVKRANGAMIDLGGLAKGYAMDRAREIAAGRGVTRGVVSMGSSIAVIGEKAGGKSYNFGLQHPRALTGVSFAAVKARDTCIAVSGDYERYYAYGGKRYCHIMDGRTGRPADTGMQSVAVFDASAARADALSTAAFVLGHAAAAELFERLGVSSLMAFTADGASHYRVTGEVTFVKDTEGNDGIDGAYTPWTEGTSSRT